MGRFARLPSNTTSSDVPSKFLTCLRNTDHDWDDAASIQSSSKPYYSGYMALSTYRVNANVVSTNLSSTQQRHGIFATSFIIGLEQAMNREFKNRDTSSCLLSVRPFLHAFCRSGLAKALVSSSATGSQLGN